MWMVGDQAFGMSGSMEGVPTALDRVPGLENAGFRPSDPVLRMEDMERDGIWSSIVYGPAALFRFPIDEREHLIAVLRAWNDWAAEEFNSYSARPPLRAAVPARDLARGCGRRARALRGARPPRRDPLAVRGRRARSDLGPALGRGRRRRSCRSRSTSAAARGSIRASAAGRSRRSPRWRRCRWTSRSRRWCSRARSSGIPGCGSCSRSRGSAGCRTSSRAWTRRSRSTASTRARSARGRASCSARQVYATFEEEPFGPELIPLLGPGNFMWACDYPHPDSTWPHSRQAIEHALGKLSPEDVRMITGENCQKLYRLP